MKRSELRDLLDGVKLKEVSEWADKYEINMRRVRYLTTSYGVKAADDGVKLVITAEPNKCACPNADYAFDAHLNPYVRDFIKGKYYPEDQIVKILFNQNYAYVDSYIFVSVSTMRELKFCPYSHVYFREEDGIQVDGELVGPSCQEIVTCHICGKKHLKRYMQQYTGLGNREHWICRTCSNEKKLVYCPCCNKTVLPDNLTMANGKVMCGSCFDERYVKEDETRNIIRKDSAVRLVKPGKVDPVYVSKDTLIKKYPEAKQCEATGTYYTDSSRIREIDGHYYSTSAASPVNGYHGWDRVGYYCTKKTVDDDISEKTLFFGTEVECQGNPENGYYVLNNYGDLFHLERDGSIGEGFEIISQPMTWKFMVENYDRIAEMMGELAHRGMKSHDTSCCGLHVHITRNAFKDDKAVKRFIAMVNAFRRNCEVIARRKDGFYYRYTHIPAEITESVYRSIARCGHGVSVNDANTNTVECRIFKGTLNPKTYFASVEFVKNLVEAANSDEAVIRFSDLIHGDYLPAYIEERVRRGNRIYEDHYCDFTNF